MLEPRERSRGPFDSPGTSPLEDNPGENTSASGCKLCLNTLANSTHTVREMMFGTKGAHGHVRFGGVLIRG